MNPEKTLKNILIIDDSSENLLLLQTLLSKAAYLVRPVTSGAAAFKTIEVAIPDLILLDIKMPGMDGFEICKKLKTSEKTKNIPIIFLSYLENTEDIVKAFEAGAIDYITKPFQDLEILARVKTQLELADIRKTLEKTNAELDNRVKERTRELENLNQTLREKILGKDQAEKTITQAFEEKKALMSELYHRTKNNMQIILALLSMKASNTSSQELRQLFSDIENKIFTMSLVQEKLYESENLSIINLKEYLFDLTNYLIVKHNILPGKITLKFDLENLNVLLDYAVPIGLILNELISNALKYAFPGSQKGEIKISLNRINEKTIEFEISDNGNGIPKSFDLRKDSSLGLKTVFMLAEAQLKGKIIYSQENGVSWNIQFEDNLYQKRI